MRDRQQQRCFLTEELRETFLAHGKPIGSVPIDPGMKRRIFFLES
jgi:hypothetical protein